MNIGNAEIKDLLEQYRSQKCSEAELDRFYDLINDHNYEIRIKEVLQSDLDHYEPDESEKRVVEFSIMFGNIQAAVQPQKQNPINLQKYSAHLSNKRIIQAAAILIFVFIGGGMSSYFIFNSSATPSLVNSYNEIKAPLGARSEVLLPDGSKVWLNAGSKIKYLDLFNKENRNILLEGEAYFKVAKNRKLPFIVKTGDLNIVAVGTEFNVKAYNDEDIIETTLVEGKISIQNDRPLKIKSETIYLEPSQKAVYIKNQRQLTVEDMKVIKRDKPREAMKSKAGGVMYVSAHIDPVPIISWKDDQLVFKSEELYNLLTKLERKYDVTIHFNSEEVRHFRFTGTLQDETLTQVLDVIKLSAPIDYRLEGKSVYISENKELKEKFSDHLKKK